MRSFVVTLLRMTNVIDYYPRNTNACDRSPGKPRYWSQDVRALEVRAEGNFRFASIAASEIDAVVGEEASPEPDAEVLRRHELDGHAEVPTPIGVVSGRRVRRDHLPTDTRESFEPQHVGLLDPSAHDHLAKSGEASAQVVHAFPANGDGDARLTAEPTDTISMEPPSMLLINSSVSRV